MLRATLRALLLVLVLAVAAVVAVVVLLPDVPATLMSAWCPTATATEGEAGEASNGAGLSEAAKIDALTDRVRALQDVVFIRNGQEHSVSDAVTYIRLQWRLSGGASDRTATARDFIDRVATASSSSGTPYRVRLADGTTHDTGPWLHGLLAQIESENPPPAETETPAGGE